MRLVSVVTSDPLVALDAPRISFMRSSIWPAVGRTSTAGSTRPVGRMICSTMSGLFQLVRPGRGARRRRPAAPWPRTRRSAAAGCRARWADGSRSRRASACGRSPSYMPWIWGSVMCDSSMKRRKSLGEDSRAGSWAWPRAACREDARVVLDAVAEAHLAQHLHVVVGALPQPLRFEELAVLVDRRSARRARAGSRRGRARRPGRGDEVRRRDRWPRAAARRAPRRSPGRSRRSLDLSPKSSIAAACPRRPARPRTSRRARGTSARGSRSRCAVLDVDQLAQHVVAVDVLAGCADHHALQVVLGRAEAEDAAHAGHDDGVAPHEQGVGGGVAQAVDLVVDRRVFLDVEVALGT